MIFFMFYAMTATLFLTGQNRLEPGMVHFVPMESRTTFVWESSEAATGCGRFLLFPWIVAIPKIRIREELVTAQVAMPTAPWPIVGLVAWRTRILPVVELSHHPFFHADGRFGESQRVPSPADPLIIVSFGPEEAALRVDREVSGTPEGPIALLDVEVLFEEIRTAVDRERDVQLRVGQLR